MNLERSYEETREAARLVAITDGALACGALAIGAIVAAVLRFGADAGWSTVLVILGVTLLVAGLHGARAFRAASDAIVVTGKVIDRYLVAGASPESGDRLPRYVVELDVERAFRAGAAGPGKDLPKKLGPRRIPVPRGIYEQAAVGSGIGLVCLATGDAVSSFQLASVVAEHPL